MEKADLEKEGITDRIKYLERPEAIDDAKNLIQDGLSTLTKQANTKQANTSDYKASRKGPKDASQLGGLAIDMRVTAEKGLSSTKNTSKVRQKTKPSSPKLD